VLGIAAFWQGDLTGAQRQFEAAIARYRPEFRGAHLVRYGLDPKALCLSRLANTLWFLGRPQAAGAARDAALALAREIGHPVTHGTALVFAALLAVDLGDEDGFREYVRGLRSWLDGHESSAIGVSAEGLEGFLDVLAGRPEQGLARLQGAVEETRAAEHAPGMHASMVRLLVAAQLVAGDARAGLAAADRRLGAGQGAGLWEAEIRRVRGEFLVALGAPAADVEAELGRALAVASRQRAIALELRVMTTILRRRLQRGDEPGADDAREGLAAVLARLPEPGRTRDREEAEALLAHR
jgi:hypothetical protein